jgi:hypothetical protein
MCHQTTRRCSSQSDEYKSSAARAGARRFHPYHRERKGNSFKWNGCEVIIKDNPIVLLVLEPREIDNSLDSGITIWVMGRPAQVGIL